MIREAPRLAALALAVLGLGLGTAATTATPAAAGTETQETSSAARWWRYHSAWTSRGACEEARRDLAFRYEVGDPGGYPLSRSYCRYTGYFPRPYQLSVNET